MLLTLRTPLPGGQSDSRDQQMIPHVTDTGRGAAVQSDRTRPQRAAEARADTVESTCLHGIWRPWTLTGREGGLCRQKAGRMSSSDRPTSKDAFGFQHPVRLCLPRSKAQQYLSHLGKKVLASFPVQATLYFYNDDSSSDEEEEDTRMGEA
ncbi:protein ripply3 [Arapaima gigas]